jgi:hypothetical protein
MLREWASDRMRQGLGYQAAAAVRAVEINFFTLA